MNREAWSAPIRMPDSPVPIPRRPFLAMNAEWRREALRMNLWLVPAIEIALAVILFAGTYAADRAIYDGHHALPSWVLTGSADAARQILTALAAAVITVIGVVFSIMIVTLTLASTQFGPRMLRNFIRDRGTQVTLGTFVATFVYTVLTLASIGPGFDGGAPRCAGRAGRHDHARGERVGIGPGRPGRRAKRLPGATRSGRHSECNVLSCTSTGTPHS